MQPAFAVSCILARLVHFDACLDDCKNGCASDWVFDGKGVPANRPSWNYRKAEGGGIILDMLAHWRYVLDTLFGKVLAVSCLGATHIPERVDEVGNTFQADADDAAYATFQLEGGAIAHFNSSWTTRVRRDDLLTVCQTALHQIAVLPSFLCFSQCVMSFTSHTIVNRAK